MTGCLMNYCKKQIKTIKVPKSFKTLVPFKNVIKINLRLLSTLRRQQASLMQTIVPQIKHTEGSFGTLLHIVHFLLW